MTRDAPFLRGGPPARNQGLQAMLRAAIDEVRAGNLDAAARALEAGGGAALKTSVGQNIRGDIFLKQGKHREALKAFDTSVRLAPTAAEGHCNRGVALQELGRLEEALAAEDNAIRLRPDHATAHFNRGNVLTALGRHNEAVAAYDRALKGRPAYAEAFINRGVALLALKRPLDALADFGRALNVRPGFVAAHLGRAKAYRDLGQHEAALAAVETAMALAPQNNEVAHARFDVLFSAERYGESLREADGLIVRDANDANAYRARAQALLKLRRFAEGLDAVDEAIRLAPQASEAHVVRGALLNDLGRFEESFVVLEEAERLGASGKSFFEVRAVAHSTLGHRDEALADFERALAFAPDDPRTHYYRGFLRISVGDWKNGWADHEWRLKLRDFAPAAEIRHIPRWRGEALKGKRLLAYAEQGNGDTFQFVRYLRQIKEDGVGITLVVRPAQREFLAANFPGVDVTEALGLRGGFDYQTSLLSMPLIFGTTPGTVPAEIPYLAAEPERVAKWRQRIGEEGFRVGIVWQGSSSYVRDRDRSIPLAAFAPLSRVPGVRLISVQAMVGLEQLDALPPGMRVERLGEEVENNPDGFREMAAAMENLDLFIMSDTGPTHLAAALGRPVWLATARYPDWRWMQEREDTPWYPNMRLFRQETADDWAGVFARMARKLEDLVAARG